MITTCPRPSSMMLAGFRSRCRTPLACAAARPAQSWRAISTSLVLRKAADAPQQGRQVFAVDVLHGEESLAIDFAHVVDAANVGMRDAAGDADFVAKALEQTFVARGFVGQKLERDRLAERQIVGAVDFAHAAFAEQRDDAVAPGDQAPGKEPSFAHQVFGGNWKAATKDAATTKAAAGAAEMSRLRRSRASLRRRCSTTGLPQDEQKRTSAESSVPQKGQ